MDAEPLPFWWKGDEDKLPPGLYVEGTERIADFEDLLIGETYLQVRQRLMLAVSAPAEHLPSGPAVADAHRRKDGWRIVRFWEIHPDARNRWAMETREQMRAREEARYAEVS